MPLLLSLRSVPLCSTDRYHLGRKVVVSSVIIFGGLPNDREEPEMMHPADLNLIDVLLLKLNCWEKVDVSAGASRSLQ